MSIGVLLAAGSAAFATRAGLGVLSVGVLAATVAAAAHRRSWIVAAAAIVAAGPAVVSTAVEGRGPGLLALFSACAAPFVVVAARRHDVRSARAPRVAVVAMGLVWFAAGTAWWWRRTPARAGDQPSLAEAVVDAGEALRAATGTVGAAGIDLAPWVVVVWWCAAGLVLWRLFVPKPARGAAVMPAAVGSFAIVAASIERWRGPVDGRDGMWILAVAVTAAAALVHVDARTLRVVGRSALVLAIMTWLAGLATLTRSDATDSWQGELAVGFAALVAAGLVFWWTSGRGRFGPGVNVVGYLDAASGLGERGRELSRVLRAAGIAVSEWIVDRTESARSSADPPAGGRAIYDTTIAVVTARELPALVETHPVLMADVDHVVGYWFWELATVPDEQEYAIGLVDAIWAPTRFVADAYASATDVPVMLVPLPVPEPDSPPSRGVGPRATGAAANEFVLLTSFDHLSVMERKNPIGAIEAFRRAFGDEPGVALVVKSMNGDRRPASSAQLAEAAGGDQRIRLVDGVVSDAELVSMIADADAFVSLHRSEGLGLQLATAMWVGTPVIATRYSGNLDLMDDESAELIDAELVPVVGGGEAYPASACWADPDLDQAAAAMRRLRDDADRRASVIRHARARMEAQADLARAATTIRSALRAGHGRRRGGAAGSVSSRP